MIYIKDTTSFNIKEKTAVSLGKFDGVHRGHELLMEELLGKKEDGLKSVAFAFDVPFADYVITTASEKIKILEKVGLDYFINCPLNEEVMHMQPEEFIKKLVDELNMKFVVVGTDFRFGYKRSGDYKVLQDFQEKYGYEVKVVSKVQDNGQDIGSTRIREALLKGDIEEANRLLGYAFFIDGKVSHGNQIGRKMSIPTVNVIIPEKKKLLPFGVYATETMIGGRKYKGATNVGVKPTVEGYNPVAIETNLFDFNDEIYSEEISTLFYKFIRPERKFDNLDELKSQIQRDIKEIDTFFDNY